MLTSVRLNAASPPHASCCSAAASMENTTRQGWAAVLTSALGVCTCVATQTTVTITFAPVVTTPTLATCSRPARTRAYGKE